MPDINTKRFFRLCISKEKRRLLCNVVTIKGRTQISFIRIVKLNPECSICCFSKKFHVKISHCDFRPQLTFHSQLIVEQFYLFGQVVFLSVKCISQRQLGRWSFTYLNKHATH